MKKRDVDKETVHEGSRGSLTVEALLFLIPFMMAFCTLINAARFVQAEMLIHHAITQTAKQISTYSYVLTKSEISDRIQKTNRKSEQFIVTLDEATSSIQGFVNAVSEPDELFENAISLIKSKGRDTILRETVKLLSKRNIENAISLLSEDPDEYLRNIGIVDGFSGLNFEKSKWLSKSEGKGNIEIVVTYKMKNLMFPDFSFGEPEFCQCAYTLIW